MKTTKGGSRAGAGRKPRAIPRKAVTVRIEPEDFEQFKKICKQRGISQADWIAEKIRTPQ